MTHRAEVNAATANRRDAMARISRSLSFIIAERTNSLPRVVYVHQLMLM